VASSRSRTPSSAYEHFEESFSGPAWDFCSNLRQRAKALLASTSTKNPDYRDVMYVEDLIGPNNRDVNTICTREEGEGETIRAVPDPAR